MHRHQPKNTGFQLQKNWKYKLKLRNCQIWQNSITKCIAEAYHVLQKQTEALYTLYFKSSIHLVGFIGFSLDKIGRLYLLTERISNRLSELHNLTENQSIKILYAAFQGLFQLECIYGIIGLTEDCICINQEGEVKIWMNPNFTSIIPIKNYNKLENNKQKVIWELIFMVERKCLNKKIINRIKQRIEKKQIVKYQQVVQELYWISEELFLNFDRPGHSKLHSQPIQIKARQSQSSYMQPKTQRFNTSNDHSNTLSFSRLNYSNQIPTQSTTNYIEQKLMKSPSITNYQHNIPNKSLRAHKRYYSNFNESSKPFENTFQRKQSNAQNYFQSHLPINPKTRNYNDCTKSAPMSPQKKVNNENKVKKNELQRKMKQEIKNKVHKYQSKKILKNEKDEVGEDSFCQNLKPELKEVQFSSEFQTFGILEGEGQVLHESNNNKKLKQKRHRQSLNIQQHLKPMSPPSHGNHIYQKINPPKFPSHLKTESNTSNYTNFETKLGKFTYKTRPEPAMLKNFTTLKDIDKIDKKYEKYVANLANRNYAKLEDISRMSNTQHYNSHNFCYKKQAPMNPTDPIINVFRNIRSREANSYKQQEKDTPKWSTYQTKQTNFR